MLNYRLKLWLLCLFSVTLTADSKIEQAFSKGNVDAQLQLFYYDIDKKTDNDAYATALGGYIKYTTDTKNPLFASIRFHTSNPVGGNLNKANTSLFNNDNNAEALTTISESFLAYKTKNRIMRIGNVMLKTPMMNDDTTRIVPWSYQGFTYTGQSIKDMKVQLYHIRAIRSFTSDTYKQESASGEFGDSGISMLSLHYNGINSLKTQAFYYYAPELYSTFVAQADYELSVSKNALFCAGLQYFRSGDGGKYAVRENKNGGDDINLLALRTSIDTDDWTISINYSQNFGLSGIVKGYGGLAKVYTTSMIANGRGNYKPETWMIKSVYNLPLNSYNSEIAFRYTNTRVHDSRGDGFKAYYLHFKHYISKEASIYLRYENLQYDTDKSDASYFRAIATYKF
ncbi:OprD family outer membrane porin [Sulfurimonas sp.]|uniref:OprD family outer membrane porin n=1 Tax=Sulfurimonas sp. TaxID=2022749 RepID=UPI003563FA8B